MLGGLMCMLALQALWLLPPVQMLVCNRSCGSLLQLLGVKQRLLYNVCLNSCQHGRSEVGINNMRCGRIYPAVVCCNMNVLPRAALASGLEGHTMPQTTVCNPSFMVWGEICCDTAGQATARRSVRHLCHRQGVITAS
ncbi:hypothetical protein COO60DRAFT_854311 [Scenedesmus sp. NREL 46B-D3]|nr:hypothetical protein COO60DRAFT_854311 [Scenedesmus sp. NREL 46B-D3]